MRDSVISSHYVRGCRFYAQYSPRPLLSLQKQGKAVSFRKATYGAEPLDRTLAVLRGLLEKAQSRAEDCAGSAHPGGLDKVLECDRTQRKQDRLSGRLMTRPGPLGNTGPKNAPASL